MSTANADETDDIVAARLNGIIAQGDAWRRGCLSEDGDIVSEFEVRLQGDDARYIEDDDSFARLDSISERSSSAVVEIRYVIDFTASSSSNKSTMAFGSWESRSLCHGRYADE